jgi:hypothetical protein
MVFYPLDHGLLRTDFGRTNGAGRLDVDDGAGRLDVDDGAERHVDEIAVGISEECRSLLRPDLLRCRIEWRDKSNVNRRRGVGNTSPAGAIAIR